MPTTETMDSHKHAATLHRKRIGIFGGSFNPIHRGHILLARDLLAVAKLDEIWFMVSPLNPFKQGDTDLLPDTTRLALVQRALEGEDRLFTSDFELHLPKPSYTYRTLQLLEEHYPDIDFTLIIGADNWLAFPRWRNAADILNHYPICIYPRRNYPVDAATLPANVQLADTPLYPVSSTDIRTRVRQGLAIDDVVSEKIIDDVRKLYAPA